MKQMKVIEFEGQNWLEIEPVPLTLNTKLPALCRLIQDDSLIGINNKREYPRTCNEMIVCTGINDRQRVISSEKIISNGCWEAFRFEVIATPRFSTPSLNTKPIGLRKA